MASCFNFGGLLVTESIFEHIELSIPDNMLFKPYFHSMVLDRLDELQKPTKTRIKKQ